MIHIESLRGLSPGGALRYSDPQPGAREWQRGGGAGKSGKERERAVAARGWPALGCRSSQSSRLHGDMNSDFGNEQHIHNLERTDQKPRCAPPASVRQR